MTIEPIEDQPGWYSLSDGWNQFPVALSAYHLLQLANQIEAVRPMLARDVQVARRAAADKEEG